jgi:hypothetical protein
MDIEAGWIRNNLETVRGASDDLMTRRRSRVGLPNHAVFLGLDGL